MNCEGCGCVINYDDDTEFCGRLVRDNNTITKLGCNKKCPQCKLCNYSKSNNNNMNNNNNKNNQNNKNTNKNNQNNNNSNKNDGKLNKKEFLKFLKEQQLMNQKDQILYRASQKRKNSNKSNILMEDLADNLNSLNNNNNYYNNNNNNNYNNYNNNNDNNNNDNNNNKSKNNKEDEINCLEQQKDTCKKEDGCNWDKDSIQCKDLEATFYTADGLEGSNFKLKVGNYDITDINDFEFIPDYISVPLGLRVKIWHKQSYVGQFDAFLGNHNERNINEKHLYKIKEIGSMQICNMKTL